MAVLNQANAAF